MLKVEEIEVWGFKHAIRGMRNPHKSWGRSDSDFVRLNDDYSPVLGENDLELMQRLCKAGPEHRKYLRQIFVSMDITAPLYWWKEYDTYKVGTVANSCSTMHTIHKEEIKLNDFSFDDFWDVRQDETFSDCYEYVIERLEKLRKLYLETKDKRVWRAIIQLLPSSYNQKRTITMNYENVVNILNQRPRHKLDEWIRLCDVLYNLPYVKDIIKTINKEENVDDKRTIMNLVSKLKKLKRQVSYWKHKYLKLKERTKK